MTNVRRKCLTQLILVVDSLECGNCHVSACKNSEFVKTCYVEATKVCKRFAHGKRAWQCGPFFRFCLRTYHPRPGITFIFRSSQQSFSFLCEAYCRHRYLNDIYICEAYNRLQFGCCNQITTSDDSTPSARDSWLRSARSVVKFVS